MFCRDLNEKNYVILLRDADRRLQGFTTLSVIEFEFEGRPLRAIFSGDTIIHQAYWGEQTLSRAWCKLAGQIKSQKPDIPLYWLLIVKGHRTYRFLCLFSKEYFPNRHSATPTAIQSLMNFLGHRKFASAYDPKRGIVSFQMSQGHLKPQYLEHRDLYKEKPDVRFFLEKNPRHGQGEELLCITELTPENMRSVARSAFVEGFQEGAHR